MYQSFHGHELLRLIGGSADPISEEQIRELSRAHFGDSPRFHTCSMSNLSLDDLLTFLYEKGKLLRENGSVTVARERICQDS